MNFQDFILAENLEFYRADKPIQSVYLDFVRRNCDAILDCGEFEALRRWLLSGPVVMPFPVRPEESHRIAREFYKSLRQEQKNK